MIRKKLQGKAKRLVAVILSAMVLMESGLSGACVRTVQAQEQGWDAVSANELGDGIQIESGVEEETEVLESEVEIETETVENVAAENVNEQSVGDAKEEISEELLDEIEAPSEEIGDWVVEDTEELLRAESSYLANTETKKVAIDPTSIASTKIYKDMDYSFLSKYPFGQSNAELATVTFSNVEELQKSEDVRLVAGTIIKTEGYYESGDGGNAVYEILSEYDAYQANRKDGAIQLANGLYACILPDVYEIDGQKWMVVSVLQYGARGDGITPSQAAISSASSSVSKHIAKDDNGEDLGEVVRGIAYIPAGEYKCAREVVMDGIKNINLIGDGDSSVLFTDNDYNKGIGYGEFLFATWNGKNLYYGDFRIEAREVDLYHYMRQFVLVYCDNMYIYNVDLIIPQESWSGYYYEDKQYSNCTLYSGNTNITIDGCKFVLFSGTYRGANFGVLDFWNREVKNITLMNCDMYSNARDEQIGIFNIPKTGANINDKTSISNVDLINNTIHTTPVKYEEVVGNQNMIFTVSYSDSVRIDDIRIAGNHFICEADSKFMTFGNATNVVVEENIIEIITTRNTGASVFDSSNGDAKNILIRNNEFFLTSEDGERKKASMTQGRMTLEGNRIFSDSGMIWGVVGQVARNNEFIFLKPVGYATGGVDLVENNKFYLYGGVTGGNTPSVSGFDITAASGIKDVAIKNNTVYDYGYAIGRRGPFSSLVYVSAYEGKERAEFSGNTYYAPNRKFKSADGYTTDDPDRTDVDWVTDENGKIQITDYYNRMFYLRVPDDKSTCTLKELIFKDNKLQGVKGYAQWNNGNSAENRTVQYTFSNNTTLPYNENLVEDSLLVSSIDLLHNNQKTTEIAVTGDSIQLDKIVRVATRDEEGNIIEEQEVTDKEIKWYTSVESMATVSQDGTVTRKMYGDVTVYAVPTDGSGVYGECTIHFLKNTATSISFVKKKVELQPGLKHYADYVVLPETGVSQNLKWTSSDENVATVSKTGLITAVSVGKALITGTTTDGSNLSATLTVDVKPVTVKQMGLNHPWLRYTRAQIGQTKQLEVNYYSPDNAENKTVKRWESLDPSVATVDDKGMVTVVGSGRAEIRAYSTDEYCYGRCVVFVEPEQVKNFKATSVGQNKVTLSWDAVDKTFGYYLYQWDATESKWTALNYGKALDKDKTSFQVSNLTAGTEYKFCIRTYFINYMDTGNSPYESQDSVVTVKTYAYNPVTYIKGGTETFTFIDYSWINHKKTFDVRYNADANYENLELDYKIADESIVKIVSIEEGSSAEKRKITLEGLKYGATTLTITANDGSGVSVEIPVGFLPYKQVSNCKAEAIYKQVDISFDGVDDESEIDGYLVASMVTLYNYNIVEYIPKTGAKSYSTVHKNVNVGTGSYGGGYKYQIFPYILDGNTYHLGTGVYANNNSAVSIPEPTKATGIDFIKEQYVVRAGENIEVSAKIANEDASTSQLYWEIVDENYATIDRLEKADGETLTDYASVTGAEAGVTKIKAVTTDGSNIQATAQLIVRPTIVQNLKAEAKNNSISLNWTEIKNAKGYVIYRWNEEKAEFEKLADVQKTNFKDSGLELSTTYRYKVSAYISVGGTKYESDLTTEVEATTGDSTEDDGGADTDSYNPVTYIEATSELFTIVDYTWMKRMGEFSVKYNSDANYENLKFDYKIADESIVQIVAVEDGNEVGEKNITLKGLKYGFTTLTITANDKNQVSVEIPVAFITAQQVKNCVAKASPEQVNISFDGLVNESGIDGYFVYSMVGLNQYEVVENIQKTGETTYYAVDKNVKAGGGNHNGGYKYVVCPYITDGTNYHLGYEMYANNCAIVQVPVKLATSLDMSQEQYIVTEGDNIEVSAIVGEEGIANSELSWEILDDNYATVERVTKTDGAVSMDYANVVGIKAGATKIKAVTTDGTNIEVYAQLIVLPVMVKDLKAEAEDTNITLRWSAVNNAQGYVIYRWNEEKAEFEQIDDVEECKYVDSNLKEDTSYRYKVAAFINVDGIKYESDLTPELGITTKESTGDNENGGTGDDENGGTGDDENGGTGDDENGGTGDNENGGTGDDENGGTGDDENGGTGDNENGNTGDEDDSDKKDMQYKIFAIGYSGVYDGKSHNAVTLEGVKKEVDTVTYSLDQKNWEETIPTVTDVKDSTTIYIKVEREGMAKAYEVMVVATVLPVSIENMDIRLKEATIEWDGENHMPEVLFGGCTLNKDYAVNGVQVYKNIGAYSVVVTGIGNYTGTKELIYTIDVVEGDKYTISGFVYKVTGDDTVSVAGVTNKKRKTVSVKATVQIGGKVYKITAIEKNAFKNSKKLKKVIIGKNITTIGTNAFYGCSKLKSITIKTTKLKNSKVGKKAFTGTPSNVKVKVPKSKVKAYDKMLKKKGIAKSGKVTK